jgi:lactate permease
MNGTTLPITVSTWLLAISPIVLLLVLLAVLRWKAPQAGPVGMFLAVLLALVFFRTPWETVAVGAGKGIWDAIFILLVIWPALLLYRVGTAAGAFDALRRGLSRYSRNHVFLVLASGWVFASFIQGIAGFGAPIAIVAPLLLAIGVRAVYAVAIPLIGHAWANMFGTLAVGWLATLQVVELDSELSTALITAGTVRCSARGLLPAPPWRPPTLIGRMKV